MTETRTTFDSLMETIDRTAGAAASAAHDPRVARHRVRPDDAELRARPGAWS